MGIPFLSSRKGIPVYIKRALVYLLAFNVADAKYPNAIGDQDRAAAGGEVFPGRALAFDGLDQCAYVADNGALDVNQASTDFCISGKIKTGSDITTLQHLFGKGSATSISGKYGFFISVGNLYFFRQTSDGYASYIDNITLAVNTEYHLTARIDLSGSKVYLYIDNVLQNAGGTAYVGAFATLSNVYEFVLGAQNGVIGSGYQDYADITIRDVRIYHKDVTSAANLASLQKGEALGDEVAWWFCEGTDLLEVHDSGGTGYHMTAANFDSTSFVEGNWQSLYNKYGYAVNVTGPEMATGWNTAAWWDFVGATWSFNEGVYAEASGGINGCSKASFWTVGKKYRITYTTEDVSGGTLNVPYDGSFVSLQASSSKTDSTIYTPAADAMWIYSLSFIGKLTATSIQAYYDTAIPPDMSTLVNGVPTHDIFGNELTFAGQAQYPAIARDRSCFIGDGVAYWDMTNDITIDRTADSTISFKCKVDNLVDYFWILGNQSEQAFKFLAFIVERLQLETNTNTDSARTVTGVPGDTDWHEWVVRINNSVVSMTKDGVALSMDDSSISDDVTFNRLFGGTTLYYLQGNAEYLTITQAGVVTADWQFVEGQGNTVYDVSGNSNHLTGVNVANNNWGVIDTPTEDYLAEHGANFARAYNGVDDYHSNPVSNYLGSATSGSVKAFVYVDSTTKYVLTSADSASGIVNINFMVVNSKPRILVKGGFTNQINADNALSDGWHLIEWGSTGSAYFVNVDDVSVAISVGSGADDGKWFDTVAGRDDVSIGAVLDSSPTYGDGQVMWVKVDDGVNGDWYYNPVDDTFTDRSALGLTMTASGSDTEQRIVPALSDKSADAVGQVIQYKQGGKNLIPYTYLSAPEVWEIYAADQEVRYGPNMTVNGTFDTDTDWVKQSTWTIANGKATYDKTFNYYIEQDQVLTTGKRYVAHFDILDLTTGTAMLAFTNQTGAVLWGAGYISYSLGSHEISFTSLEDATKFRIYGHTASGSAFSIDNLTLYEETTQTGNNLIDNGGARNAIGALTTTDWADTAGLGDGYATDATPTIVTGNGFSGNAQRIDGTIGEYIQFDTDKFINGQSYLITFKYRADDTFKVENEGVEDVETGIAVNTGDAISKSITYSPAAGAGKLRLTLEATGYLEIDEIEQRTIIDGEFYEPEVLGGDPVIVGINYLLENGNGFRYLTRYVNQTARKDLMLIAADNTLTYEDHIKLLNFCKLDD